MTLRAEARAKAVAELADSDCEMDACLAAEAASDVWEPIVRELVAGYAEFALDGNEDRMERAVKRAREGLT